MVFKYWRLALVDRMFNGYLLFMSLVQHTHPSSNLFLHQLHSILPPRSFLVDFVLLWLPKWAADGRRGYDIICVIDETQQAISDFSPFSYLFTLVLTQWSGVRDIRFYHCTRNMDNPLNLFIFVVRTMNKIIKLVSVYVGLTIKINQSINLKHLTFGDYSLT